MTCAMHKWMRGGMKHPAHLAAALVLLTMLAGGSPINPTTASETTMTETVPAYMISQRLPGEIRQMVNAGEITKAIEALQQIDSTEAWPLEEAERLQWLKRDYSLSANAMLRKIQADLPDVTMTDIAAWTRSREIQWLTIDGVVRYFRREPANLYRFSESAKARRDAAAKKATSAGDPSAGASSASPLDRHIEAVVKSPKAEGEPLLNPSRYAIRHTIRIKPGVVPKSEMIRCWMPLPREYRQQSGPQDLVTTPAVHRVSGPGAVHNTVYMQQPSAGDVSTVFSAEYSYTNHAWAPRFTTAAIEAVLEKPATDMGEFLREEPPHIVFSTQLQQLAASIVGDERNPYRKAERIFRWMDENIRYCAEMEYATIAGISEKILQTRRGDCGVQAILFITLCRAAGVPARWQSGWVTQPKHWNMHDWTEFYVEPAGWLPADPSIGFRKSDDPAVREFLFGNIDAYRMIANSGICGEFDPPKKHHRSDPVDSQRGEVETDRGNLYFDQWEYDVEILRHEEPQKAAEGKE